MNSPGGYIIPNSKNMGTIPLYQANSYRPKSTWGLATFAFGSQANIMTALTNPEKDRAFAYFLSNLSPKTNVTPLRHTTLATVFTNYHVDSPNYGQFIFVKKSSVDLTPPTGPSYGVGDTPTPVTIMEYSRTYKMERSGATSINIDKEVKKELERIVKHSISEFNKNGFEKDFGAWYQDGLLIDEVSKNLLDTKNNQYSEVCAATKMMMNPYLMQLDTMSAMALRSNHSGQSRTCVARLNMLSVDEHVLQERDYPTVNMNCKDAFVKSSKHLIRSLRVFNQKPHSHEDISVSDYLDEVIKKFVRNTTTRDAEDDLQNYFEAPNNSVGRSLPFKIPDAVLVISRDAYAALLNKIAYQRKYRSNVAIDQFSGFREGEGSATLVTHRRTLQLDESDTHPFSTAAPHAPLKKTNRGWKFDERKYVIERETIEGQAVKYLTVMGGELRHIQVEVIQKNKSLGEPSTNLIKELGLQNERSMDYMLPSGIFPCTPDDLSRFKRYPTQTFFRDSDNPRIITMSVLGPKGTRMRKSMINFFRNYFDDKFNNPVPINFAELQNRFRDFPIWSLDEMEKQITDNCFPCSKVTINAGSIEKGVIIRQLYDRWIMNPSITLRVFALCCITANESKHFKDVLIEGTKALTVDHLSYPAFPDDDITSTEENCQKITEKFSVEAASNKIKISEIETAAINEIAAILGVQVDEKLTKEYKDTVKFLIQLPNAAFSKMPELADHISPGFGVMWLKTVTWDTESAVIARPNSMLNGITKPQFFKEETSNVGGDLEKYCIKMNQFVGVSTSGLNSLKMNSCYSSRKHSGLEDDWTPVISGLHRVMLEEPQSPTGRTLIGYSSLQEFNHKFFNHDVKDHVHADVFTGNRIYEHVVNIDTMYNNMSLNTSQELNVANNPVHKYLQHSLPTERLMQALILTHNLNSSSCVEENATHDELLRKTMVRNISEITQMAVPLTCSSSIQVLKDGLAEQRQRADEYNTHTIDPKTGHFFIGSTAGI